MSSLEVTDVKVWPLKNLKPGSKLKANCRVTFNNSITLNGKLWDSKNGLFVGADGNFGEKKNDQGQTEKIFYSAWSINREDRNLQDSMKQAVIQAYNRIMSGDMGSNVNTNSNQVSHQHQPQSQNLTSNDVPF